MALFEQLNAPFRYSEYEYSEEDNLVYINGQTIAQRLNEVLGVGYWCYKPVEIEKVDRKGRNDKDIEVMVVLVEFSFYNKELGQWVSFTDAGSQDMNVRMQKGDATKSAITDAMKKCASRIGVASDVYKGLIHHDKGAVVLPVSYKNYYDEKGWKDGLFDDGTGKQPKPKQTKNNKPLSEKQVNRLYAIALTSGRSKESVNKALKDKFNIDDPKFLTKEQYDQVCEGYEKNPKK